MSDAGAVSRPAWLDTLVQVGATAALVVAATLVMFSAFMYYDDEGYVLLSLRNFAEHGGLYRDVFSQYGPFPYVLYYTLERLGLPLTHTTGRLLTIGAWAGAALCCAGVVGSATRSIALRLAALSAAFIYLWVMASEPTHPGGLIVLTTVVLGALGYHFIRANRMHAWALLAGAASAVLLLTKINVGVFAAYSVGAWYLLNHGDHKIQRWAPLAIGVSGVLLPLALMRPLLGTAWVQIYAFVFATSAIAIALASSTTLSARAGWRTLGCLVCGGTIAAAIVIGVILLRGTGPGDLLHGIILAPLRQPIAFSLRYVWPMGIVGVGSLSLLLCAAALWLRRSGIQKVDVGIAGLRLVAAAGLMVGVAQYPDQDPVYIIFGFLLPGIWPFVWRLPDESNTATSARLWMALLLLGQSLHPFPVPGSQIAWGTVLVIPLAAIGAWEAAAWLVRRIPMRLGTARAASFGISSLLVAFAVLIGWRFANVAKRYEDGEHLAQPGAEAIRLPERSAGLFRVLTVNATAHADMLFSLPGMFSLNIWSGLPTPTQANVTHWFSLLDAPRQQAIISQLEAHPLACVVIDRGHVEFLSDRNLAPRGLLHDYIARAFEPAFIIDRFEFCVRRGRNINPFLVADLLTRSDPAEPAASGSESTLLRLTLPFPTRETVAGIELLGSDGRVQLGPHNTRIEVAPASGKGEAIGPRAAQTWPLQLNGPTMLFIYFEWPQDQSIPHHGTIVLRSASGEELGIARLRE